MRNSIEVLKRRSKGFSAVGIVVVVVAVAVLGLAAWRVYYANKPKYNNQNSANSQSPKQANSNTQRQPAVTYLDIKELGIKIKLSDDIKDATYYYDTSGSMPVARVSTKLLISKSGGTCDPKTSQPFGTITKSQTLALPTGVTLTVDNTNVFRFGNDYIIYSTPNQPCGTEPDVIDLETAQLQSFKEVVKTMQAD